MQQINIGSQTIDYEVIRTERKTVGIILDNDKNLTIRSPRNTGDDEIRQIIERKTSWILKKLAEIDKIKPPPEPREFISGEKLSYLGRKYRIKTTGSGSIKKVNVMLYQGRFIIEYPKSLEQNEEKRRKAVRDELISWYREHAREKIEERVEKYRKILGVNPNNVVIKKQKRIWGSCSGKKNLNFNWKIIMAPLAIVDYLVVHELAHLKNRNHSRHFWQTVETVIPDYQKRLEWLKVNGRRLDF